MKRGFILLGQDLHIANTLQRRVIADLEAEVIAKRAGNQITSENVPGLRVDVGPTRERKMRSVMGQSDMLVLTAAGAWPIGEAALFMIRVPFQHRREGRQDATLLPLAHVIVIISPSEILRGLAASRA